MEPRPVPPAGQKPLPDLDLEEDNVFYGKVLRKIYKWSKSPYQINSKIVRAYFMAEDLSGDGEVSLDYMKLLCSDRSRDDLYVQSFDSNFYNMTFDGPQSHGKVFDKQGDKVVLWDYVAEEVLKYKDAFYPEGQ